MENFSYSSYPDSGNSSPRSREIDDAQLWDDQPPTASYKVKFLCSYGGKIQPKAHDNQLAYVGGDTKILAVDRNIKFHSFMNKLSSLSGDADICFKYQLPGEDLDALISVTNDEDLEHMMLEYDRLFRASAKPARLRLFLFHLNPPAQGNEVKSEREWFVDALNSVNIHNLEISEVEKNPDFLFGLDKAAAPTTPAAEVATEDVSALSEELHGVCSIENIAPPPTAVPMPMQMPIHAAYVTERPMTTAGGGYSDPQQQPQQPVYLIPSSVPGMFQASQGLRASQGYYGAPRVMPEVYLERPVYNVAPGVLQQQQLPQKFGGYAGGNGILQTNVGMAEQGYLQVGYDSAGRQVYLTAPYMAVAAGPVGTVDGTQSGGDGKGDKDTANC